MSTNNIDWKQIRPIKGSQSEGFEELCCHLARDERPKGTDLERKGKPDAGMECLAVFEDGREWGWHTKYFFCLGDSQWRQIDRSIRTALEKHPRLVRYYVCVPLDRSDARVGKRLSQKDRWDQRVEKWKGWARERGLEVQFEYWGNSELLELLSRPKNRSRLPFWFGEHVFDIEWFEAQLEESIAAAGPRYTPEVHVELPIAARFEALGRTTRFFEALNARARPLRDQLRSLKHSIAFSIQNDKRPSTIDEFTDQTAAVADSMRRIIDELGELDPVPAGPLAIEALVEKTGRVLAAAELLGEALLERERTADEEKGRTDTDKSSSPHRDLRYKLYKLQQEVREFSETLKEEDKLANAPVMLLTGQAGSGKTHLLCDVARTRLQDGRPTVLLMGHRFLSNQDPWTQALRHLDLADLSAEEFVGALESAAQVANCRALVLIDALNEGAGRRIWPQHLASFLVPLSRSKWIAVVLAVRSSYEHLVVPEEVRNRAVRTEHYGFGEHEHDAARTFFEHYGIERLSTPLSLAEFRNPLYLKMLCEGLKKSGQSRFPRGFQGFSATFKLFFDAVNHTLSKELDFDPKSQLVWCAVKRLATAFVERQGRWLPREDAKDLVNGLLPDREFDRSLYLGLVREGVLIEEAAWHDDGACHEVVQISYERLADHLVAERLLDLYLEFEPPEASVGENGLLAFLAEAEARPGLLQALCMQVPERTGRELSEMVPKIAKQGDFPDAFRESLIWRAPSGFPETTLEDLNRAIRNEPETLGAVLMLATTPEHPLNAWYLHKRLSQEAMPDRDAWWSIYLHHAWGAHGAVDRLVEWAWTVESTDALEAETVDLAATALAWMLTTPNRYLRDRATKALVSLLTGRLAAVVRLIERFVDIDDPYITERLYAVAYGCTMRSHDVESVAHVAQVAYRCVFAEGPPPAHILLRDYARGVIEWALDLGCSLDVVPDSIRPPYQTAWPHIPTEEELEPLKPHWGRGSPDSDDLEWGRNRIRTSVLSDDFAFYVIGTNWRGMTAWLSLRLAERTWQSEEGPPPFDLSLIQRYILSRVFDLGWTKERFGRFDRYDIRHHGDRSAAKAERVGKKYQWIAYHEIMALVADHFQFRGEDADERAYEGPWQSDFRDIDPSCTLRGVHGGIRWETYPSAWWCPTLSKDWSTAADDAAWLQRTDDIPPAESLLIATCPDDDSAWLNLNGHFNWTEPVPPDQAQSVDSPAPGSIRPKRNLELSCHGFLVRTVDVKTYMEWAERTTDLERWLPRTPQVHRMFLGEHEWSPAARHFQAPCYGDPGGWVEPEPGCPIRARDATFSYVKELGGFDCSVDDRYELQLPADHLLRLWKLKWSGRAADFVDENDQLIAFDPTAHKEGPPALLVRQRALEQALKRDDLTLCWIVRGEKCMRPVTGADRSLVSLSGVYIRNDDGTSGFLRITLYASRSDSSQLLATRRSP